MIACVGDNCVDRYVVGGTAHESPGGNALNVAARLGAAYLGAVGDDAEGGVILDGARRAGVDVSLVEVRPGRSGVTLVALDEHGERRFLSEEYGVAEEYRIAGPALARLRRCDWVHAARQPDLPDLAEDLRRHGARLSYDFCDAWDDAFARRACALLDVAFFSGDAHAAARAVAHGAQVGVATLGASGSVAYTEAGETYQPAVPTTVVDTLGAGDALIAAFVAARRAGRDVAGCLQEGAGAAARACEHLGAWPLREEAA